MVNLTKLYIHIPLYLERFIFVAYCIIILDKWGTQLLTLYATWRSMHYWYPLGPIYQKNGHQSDIKLTLFVVI